MPHIEQIDEWAFRDLLNQLDSDQNGVVSKEEFKGPYVKLNPQTTDADYDALWEEIDFNGDKALSFEELAAYFGFNLKTLTGEEMSDEKIMELFSLQAQMLEIKMKDEQLRNPPTVVAGPFIMPRRLSRGSDGTRRCITIMTDTERRACGVTACKLATRQIALNGVEPTDVEFLMACDIQDVETIERMLEAKTDVRVEDERGEMALHKLARSQARSRIKYMKAVMAASSQKQTDLDWQDKKGRTPLMFATEAGHVDAVGLLLDCGADALLQDDTGGSALHHAVMGKSTETIKTLLSDPKFNDSRRRHDFINLTDSIGRSALHLASFNECEEMTKTLIEFGATSFADAWGNKPSGLAGKTGRRNSRDLLEALEVGTVS